MNLFEQAIEILRKDASEKKLSGRIMTCENYCQYRGQAVWDLLEHMNIFEDDINSFNIIHVAGTKGKGSTCTFIESILRKSGIKTGIFTSPHMVDLTERIMINGEPISKEYFGKIFQRLWTNEGRRICEEYPRNSLFLVCLVLAFHAFLDCQVEVAIIEVGKGGEYDLTNIISNPIACAITFLELEHTNYLGNDLKSIAWHKSGIFKKGKTAFTWPQTPEAMEMLHARAVERNCRLVTIPDLSYFKRECRREIQLGLSGKHQEMNASLAVQVCNFWLQKIKTEKAGTEVMNGEAHAFQLSKNYLHGLKHAAILGRQQIVNTKDVTFYLDVAHTKSSLQAAADWFQHSSKMEEEAANVGCSKILIVSINGDRDLKNILPPLKNLQFDNVIFTPSIFISPKGDSYLSCDYLTDSELTSMAHTTAKSWRKLDIQREYPSKEHIVQNINQAAAWILKGRNEELFFKTDQYMGPAQLPLEGPPSNKHLQILVTGTFRIVRVFLMLLRGCY